MRENAAVLVGLGVGVLLSSVLLGRTSTHDTAPTAPMRRLGANIAPATRTQEVGWQRAQEGTPCSNQLQLSMQYPFLCLNGGVFGIVDAQDATTPVDPGPYCATLVSYVVSDQQRVDIPTSLGQCTHLLWLAIRYSVKGTVPTEIGALTHLQVLHIGHNRRLTGTMPSELFRLSNCQVFQVCDNLITGTIPSQIGSMQKLVVLNLSQNHFEGALPSELGLISQVTNLQLGHNLVEGPVPTQLFQLTALHLLDLSHSRLAGTLSALIGRLSGLRALLLNNNDFHGTLPDQLSRLSALTLLDVSSNHLQSSVLVLVELPALRNLSVACNDFDGKLPRQLGALDQLNCTESGLQNAKCGWMPENFLGWFSYLLVCVLAAVVTMLIVGVGSFIWRHRTNAPVRATNPKVAIATLVSLQLLVLFPITYGYPLLEHTNRTAATVACKTNLLLVGLGAVGLFSTTFVRNFVVWRIFDNPSMTALSLRPRRLLAFVAATELVAVLLLLPPVLGITKAIREPGCMVGPQAFFYVQTAYLGAWLVACGALAFKVRRVRSPHNETVLLARATFNFITFGVMLIVIASITEETTTRFLSISLCVLFSCSSIVVMLHAGRINKVLWNTRVRARGRVVGEEAVLQQPLVDGKHERSDARNDGQGLD